MPTGQVNFVVALRAEAEPVIEYFGMSPVDSEEGFCRFGNIQSGIGLILSGIGRNNAATAVCHQACETNYAAWINLGTVVHYGLPLGAPRIAHKVHCVPTRRSWYPQFVFEIPCPTATVRTIDRISENFPTDDLYDTEASGFYEAAAQFSPHEMIHSFKVVHDIQAKAGEALPPGAISSLVEDNLKTFNSLIEPLQRLSAELSQRRVDPEELRELLHKLHFTTTQRRQLRRLLRRWPIICPQVKVTDWVISNGLTDANSVITSITEHLESIPPTFGL